MTENILEEIKRIVGEEYEALEKHIQKATGTGDPNSYDKAMTVLGNFKKSTGVKDKEKIEEYIKIVTEKYCEALFE